MKRAKRLISLILVMALAVMCIPVSASARNYTEEVMLKEYFDAHYGGKSKVFVYTGDLTQDGSKEMIVMDYRRYYDISTEPWAYLRVFDVVNGKVKEIYSDKTGAFHLQRQFSAYIYYNYGYAFIVLDQSNVFQGYGDFSFTCFYFKNSKKKIKETYSIKNVKIPEEEDKYRIFSDKRNSYVMTPDTVKITVDDRDETTVYRVAFRDVLAPYSGTPFYDINTHWGRESIKWAYSNGLFSGTTETQFSPEGKMNRAMVATVLHRLAGKPSAGGGSSFTDVPEGQFYTQGVQWASKNGVISGTGNGKYEPNANVTREQLVSMLYRYAQKFGVPTDKKDSLSSFSDSGKVSGWAKNAMEWAVGSGVLSGKENNRLDPQGFATRAEVAAILKRFMS